MPIVAALAFRDVHAHQLSAGRVEVYEPCRRVEEQYGRRGVDEGRARGKLWKPLSARGGSRHRHAARPDQSTATSATPMPKRSVGCAREQRAVTTRKSCAGNQRRRDCQSYRVNRRSTRSLVDRTLRSSWHQPSGLQTMTTSPDPRSVGPNPRHRPAAPAVGQRRRGSAERVCVRGNLESRLVGCSPARTGQQHVEQEPVAGPHHPTHPWTKADSPKSRLPIVPPRQHEQAWLAAVPREDICDPAWLPRSRPRRRRGSGPRGSRCWIVRSSRVGIGRLANTGAAATGP